MPFNAIDISLVVASYLLGSISSAIILAKLMGLPDPRQHGSNNPGATNMMRIGGKKAAAITLFGDMLKGVIPVVLAHWLGSGLLVLLACGFAAFLGHLFPVFFRFKGGKGVATAIGVHCALHPYIGLTTIGVWLAVFGLLRISSVSALVAFTLTPGIVYFYGFDKKVIGVLLLMSALLIYRHRSNIRNLLQGNEGNLKKQ